MTASHALLINPWIYDFAAYDLWAKPLGLLYLAAFLERNGWRVDLIDCLDVHHPALLGRCPLPARRADHRGHYHRQEVAKPSPLANIPRRYYRFGMPAEVFEEILDTLPRPQAVLVTSGMTYWYQGVHEVTAAVRRQFPGVPVLVGGTYATLCTEHAQRVTGADVVVRGPGERPVTEFLADLSGGAVFQPPLDLDGLPYPAFHLYAHLDYVCVRTSRGCPFGCTYCAAGALNQGFLTRDPDAVADEICHWINEYAVKDVVFYDDALLCREEHIVSLLGELKRRRVRARFHTPNGLHARGMTGEIAQLMYECGFATVRVGLETSSPERQGATGGKVTTNEFVEAVACLRAAGYQSHEIGAYILVGLPGQTREEVEETITVVRESGARPYLAEYSPLPGTGLWEEARACSPFDVDAEPLFHNNTILPCRWERLTWEDLRELKDVVHITGEPARCASRAKVI